MILLVKDLYDEGHMNAAEAFKAAAPEQAETYKKWQEAVFKKTPFDEKTVELMALVAAVALQCEYCIDTHRQKAKARGATNAELAAAVEIAAALRAGSATSYGIEALREK